MKIEYGVASKNYKYICLIADAILNMELMNGGGCGKIIFGTRHKSTDYWTINVRKFKYNQNQKQRPETKKTKAGNKRNKKFFKQA